jgi:hypothetical protein
MPPNEETSGAAGAPSIFFFLCPRWHWKPVAPGLVTSLSSGVSVFNVRVCRLDRRVKRARHPFNLCFFWLLASAAASSFTMNMGNTKHAVVEALL